MKSTIGVLIATKNRPELLYNAIQSVLSQTYQSFNIYVTNDGGEDVKNIIDSFQDKRIHYYRHEISLGLSAARNNGIKHSDDLYLTCLDDDDLLGKWHLEFLVRYLTETSSQIVYTNAIRNVVQKNNNGIYQTVYKDIPYDIEFDSDLILIQNITPVETVGFSRKAINELGMFDETLTRYEDYDLWIRISRKYPMFHIPIPTCEFLWRNDLEGNSMSSTPDGQFTNLLPVIYKRYWQTAKDQIWVANAMNQILQQRGLQPLFNIQYKEE